jgi:hypothetical protein
MSRRRHRYQLIEQPQPSGIVAGIEICRHCATVRECIGTVGDHLRIRSYVRADGIRFTGVAPRCERL